MNRLTLFIPPFRQCWRNLKSLQRFTGYEPRFARATASRSPVKPQRGGDAVSLNGEILPNL
jgi:hypothetical protein